MTDAVKIAAIEKLSVKEISPHDSISQKAHLNIKAYHHYINKFSNKKNEYYIRITVREDNVKLKRTGKNYIHSTAITDISIIKNSDGFDRFRVINPGVKNTSPFIDLKLLQFLNSVKQKKEQI